MNGFDAHHQRLFSRACDGQLTDSEHAELQQLLRKSPELRANYLVYAGMHADLYGAVRLSKVRENIVQEIEQGAVTIATPHQKRLNVGTILSLAIAATLLIGFLVQRDGGLRQGDAVAVLDQVDEWPGVVATIKRVDSVIWSENATPFVVDETLNSGNVLKFEGGLLEVEFRQGAIVVLEGPAHFVPNDANHATLYAGKLAAIAPPWATGFRVATPKLDVVDHGTEFAITVGGDASDPHVDVVVTEGEVEVLTPDRQKDGRRLFAGEGVRSTGEDVSLHDTETARQLTEKLPNRPELKNTTVVGDRWYDWRPGVEGEPRREGDWRYFTNQNGPFEASDKYTELVWHSETQSYRPADHDKHPARDKYVRVHREGGHPGKGSEQSDDKLDHYSIAGFIVPEDGVYRIEAGWLERHDTHRWDQDRVLDIAAHVNNGPVLFRAVCNRSGFVAFRGPLGSLRAGDMIYVGVGPNGVDFGDRFRWGFYVVREDREKMAAAMRNDSR